MKFDVAQVVNIILQHWFLVDLTFQLSEFEDEDEKEGSSSIESNFNVKSKGPTTSFQVKLIDLDSPPQTQQEVGQLNQQPFSGSTLKKNILPAMGSFYMGGLQ